MGQGWSAGYEKPDLTIVDSQFIGNSATTSTGAATGGAIGGRALMGDVSITSSTFAENTATSVSGGAIGGAVGVVAHDSTMKFSLLNTTMTGNSTSGTTDDSGGAMYAKTAPLSVDFSTITGNSADQGGGIFSIADTTLTNSIVNNNTASVPGADVAGSALVTSDHSLFTSAASVSGSFTHSADTLFSASAQVDALADNGGVMLPDGSTIKTMFVVPGALAESSGTITPASAVMPADDQRGSGFPRVVSGVTNRGAIGATPRPSPQPTPSVPPSAPRDVTGVPGDREVAVSWTAPASSGSFPVTNYQVTAGPGGRTCLATAPTLTCTVTGLTNGVEYTFVVKALSGAGWSPASAASPAVTPTQHAITLVEGDRIRDGAMDRVTASGTTSGLPAGAKLTPYIRLGADGEFVKGESTVAVDRNGRYTWSRMVKPGHELTAYMVYRDAVSNRVVWQRLSQRSLTLFQGRRESAGMHDRITTGGTSVGVPSGVRLTPWIRYGDTGAFSEGKATILVRADGGFTWKRWIAKGRKFTAFVAYEDLESNRVIWKKVR